MAGLHLKLIVHYGSFLRQAVGGRPRVAGPDVVLAHRLLKNRVAGRAYALLSDPAAERLGIDPVLAGRTGARKSFRTSARWAT